MRVMSIFFAFLLVMGISLGGSALVGSIPAMAQDDPQGEIPGGEMADEAMAIFDRVLTRVEAEL